MPPKPAPQPAKPPAPSITIEYAQQQPDGTVRQERATFSDVKKAAAFLREKSA